jgi:hypothetical protein
MTRSRWGVTEAVGFSHQRLCFAADHPVTLRWTCASGALLERRGQLRRVTDTSLSVMMGQMISAEDSLRIGTTISAEAGVDRTSCVALIRGRVHSIESRLIRINIKGGIEVRERRKFRRAQPKFPLATAVPMEQPEARHFLVRPIDLSAGGIRIRHHVDLKAGARLQLHLKLKQTLTLSPVAEVIETWQEKSEGRPTFVSRMAFVDLQPMQEKILGSYVSWLLKPTG